MSTAPTLAQPSRAQPWLRAVRAFSFTASAVPTFVALALAAFRHDAVDWALVPLVLVASLLFHAGTNYVSDYYDFIRGVDRPGTKGSSGVLVEGLLDPKAVRNAGLLCFALGSALGLVLVSLRGPPMLLVGLAGLAGGYLYCGGPRGYKYLALGDVGVFLLMGPMMVQGAHLAITGARAWTPSLAAVPVGLLVTGILAGNNLRDIRDDSESKVRTVATVLGHDAAARWYALLLVGAYGALPVLVLTKILPWTSLAAVLTLPLAVKNVKAALGSRPGDAAIDLLDQQSAQLHLGFGVLLSIGTALGRLL